MPTEVFTVRVGICCWFYLAALRSPVVFDELLSMSLVKAWLPQADGPLDDPPGRPWDRGGTSPAPWLLCQVWTTQERCRKFSARCSHKPPRRAVYF